MKQWTAAEEAERLARRFVGVNQAEFARTHQIKGGASMVNQHIHGRRPLSLEAAVAYARGFNCSLAEISPRLASQIKGAAVDAGGEGAMDRAIAPAIRNAEPSAAAALEVLGRALEKTSQQNRDAIAGMLASFARDPSSGAAIAEAIAHLLTPSKAKSVAA